MHLYHVPGTRSTRVLWLLEEIGAPYDLTVLSRDERTGDEHIERHPLGRVPVVDDGSGFVFESAGIVLHIADLHPELGLVPMPGTHERALAYQWIFLAMTELEPAIVDRIRAGETDPERAEAARGRAYAAAAVIDRVLEGHEYLVGDRFGVADVVAGSVLSFARRYGAAEGLANVADYVERLEARPARLRADAVVAA